MVNKYFILFFLAVGVLALSGCVEEKKTQTTVEDLKAKFLESSNSMKSYSFDSITTAESSGMKFDIPMSGKVDIPNKKAYISTEMLGMKTEMYMINDTVYMKNMEIWTKISEKAEFEDKWKQSNQYNANIELLRDAKAEITGEEDIRGEKCYVLKVTPDVKKFFRQIMSQSGEVNEKELEEVEKSITEMSVKFWISEKTRYIAKTDMLMKMNIDVTGTKMDVNMRMVMNIYDYNKPMAIEPPEEALNAGEFDFEMPPQIPPE